MTVYGVLSYPDRTLTSLQLKNFAERFGQLETNVANLYQKPGRLARLSGARMQHGYTADMLFPVPFLISYISRFMTLEPGDVIATGTPARIGAFRQRPVYLQPGDLLLFGVRGGTMEHLIA